jgi:hypothetical protein
MIEARAGVAPPAARVRSGPRWTAVVRDRARRLVPDARQIGALVCAAGLASLAHPSLLTTAIGVELLALAFWLWARAAPDAGEQIGRWAWLRRPASALWLAFALDAILPAMVAGPHAGAVQPLRLVQAAAVAWAGLELLASLPLVRTYSDLPGPYLDVRSWLPVLMPTTGFLVLWRHAPLWSTETPVREVAVLLLAITTVLATLRAFARRAWTASLRWLVLIDCTLGAMVLASSALPYDVTLLLWTAATGAHTFLLAGELRGSAPRRGAMLTRLWRIASWTALACLAWPAAALNGPDQHGRIGTAVQVGLTIATLFAGWIVVGRMIPAGERRTVMRPEAVITMSHAAALGILALAFLSIGMAWWAGFEPTISTTLAALGPMAIGGWTAVLSRQQRTLRRSIDHLVTALRGPARKIFELFVRIEGAIVAGLGGLTRAMSRPLHDLHTGDAQEYLLFLVGLAVLAMILQVLK